MERVVRSKSTKIVKKGKPSLLKPAKAVRKKQKKSKVSKSVSFWQERAPVVDKGSPPQGRHNDGRSASSTRSLRQMSIKICEKVKSCGKTTCNEIADDLLQMIRKEEEQEGSGKMCDDKNIRRRLYDSLNVLEAVNVLVKDSKDITWKGMPDSEHEQARRLKSEGDSRRNEVKEKQDAMREQVIQQVTYHNLVRHNQRRHNSNFVRQANKIPVPFVLVNAHPNAEVHCDASRDMSHIMVDVNAPFALNDENFVLSQLGL